MAKTIKCKIAGVPKDYLNLSFGRQIEFLRKIEEFKGTAKTTHVNQKRRSSKAAWSEFVKLYEAKEYFASFMDESHCRDDSYQVWYK